LFICQGFSVSEDMPLRENRNRYYPGSSRNMGPASSAISPEHRCSLFWRRSLLRSLTDVPHSACVYRVYLVCHMAFHHNIENMCQRMFMFCNLNIAPSATPPLCSGIIYCKLTSKANRHSEAKVKLIYFT